MLSDLFFLMGILYFWTKLLPKASEAILERVQNLKSLQVKNEIFRLLIEQRWMNIAPKVLDSVDQAGTDYARLCALLAKLKSSLEPGLQKTS